MPFSAGLRAVRRRYADFGLSYMLPLRRVLVGSESVRDGAFGGFHHPDQGYRHLQMFAVVTMYGPLNRDTPERPGLAQLDLLRAYAHDCLHYGSRRRYVDVDGIPVRTQYGINFRRVTGQTYSSADPKDTPHTRNLGVVMEGACDREARRITRETAAGAGYREPDDELGRIAFRDVTGTLTAEDVRPEPPEGEADEASRYVGALRQYETGVNRRYARFLADFAPGEEEDLHTLVLRAIISGETETLGAWLNARHGPGTFAGMFRSGAYFTPAPIVSA